MLGLRSAASARAPLGGRRPNRAPHERVVSGKHEPQRNSRNRLRRNRPDRERRGTGATNTLYVHRPRRARSTPASGSTIASTTTEASARSRAKRIYFTTGSRSRPAPTLLSVRPQRARQATSSWIIDSGRRRSARPRELFTAQPPSLRRRRRGASSPRLVRWRYE